LAQGTCGSVPGAKLDQEERFVDLWSVSVLESVLAYYCLAVSMVVWEGGAPREAKCYNMASNMVEKSEIEP
jgi:hypothetical protein